MISVNKDYIRVMSDMAKSKKIRTVDLPLVDGDTVKLQCIKVSKSIMCIVGDSNNLRKMRIPTAFRDVFNNMSVGEDVVIDAIYREYIGTGKNKGVLYAKLLPVVDTEATDSEGVVDSELDFIKYNDLPFDTAVIEVVEVTKSKFIFEFEDTKYKTRLPGHSSWNDVYVDSGERIIVELVAYGINGLRRTLKFVDYIESDEDNKERRRVRPHHKHRWTPERDNGLIKAVNNGVSVDRLATDNKTGFTKGAIYNRLYKLGYRVKNGIAYKVKEK